MVIGTVSAQVNGEIEWKQQWNDDGEKVGYFYVNKTTPSDYEMIALQKDRNPIRFVTTIYVVKADGSRGMIHETHTHAFRTKNGKNTARMIDELQILYPKFYIYDNLYVKVLRQFKNPKIRKGWIDAGYVEHRLKDQTL
jgi:hypothetical protein